MRFKLHHFTEKLKNAITQAPVEIVVSMFYWIIIWLDIAKITDIREFGWTFPICFCMIYAINHWTHQRVYRWIYFASIIIVPLFWLWQPAPMAFLVQRGSDYQSTDDIPSPGMFQG